MPTLWARSINNNRITAHVTVPLEDAPHAALEDACRALDIPRPMWLGKHEREYDRFGRTSFLPEHFIEGVGFDRLEIERVDPDRPREKTWDPRSEA